MYIIFLNTHTHTHTHTHTRARALSRKKLKDALEALGVKMEQDDIDKLLEKTRKYLWRKKNAGGGFGMVCLRSP
jgi:hypothetical protein